MRIEVRWMLESDVARAVAIENCWDYLSKWGEQGYRNVLRHPYVYCSLVAEAKLSHPPSRSRPRAVVGLAVLAMLVDHGELCNLIVLPQYLGKAVGQQLLNHCLEVARQRALNRVFLEVRHSNRRESFPVVVTTIAIPWRMLG